jgi:hypothetical protein
MTKDWKVHPKLPKTKESELLYCIPLEVLNFMANFLPKLMPILYKRVCFNSNGKYFIILNKFIA